VGPARRQGGELRSRTSHLASAQAHAAGRARRGAPASAGRPERLGPAAPETMGTPPTRYARSGDASIAYQVVGDGPLDLVLVLGFATHLELQWEMPPSAHFFERIASFSRLILFDKRGTGLSDPVSDVPTLEQRIDDVRAVMDAAGSERAALFGISEGGPMSILFAASHPDRISALVLYGSYAKGTPAPDYFPEMQEEYQALTERMDLAVENWGEGRALDIFAPSFASSAAIRSAWALFERAA